MSNYRLREKQTQHPKELHIVIVIPALNEENGIGLVLDRVNKAMEPYSHRVLVVDGNSSDGTIRIAKDRGALVIFQSNKGYGEALRTGFTYACESLKADIVVMLDADGTYDPHDIPALLRCILENRSDMVVGNRLQQLTDGTMPFINVVGNRILSLTARIVLQLDVSDTQCGLRALHASLIRRVRIESDGMSFAIEMLARAKQAGARISEVPISYWPRYGNSKLNRFRDGFDILRTILRHATQGEA